MEAKFFVVLLCVTVAQCMVRREATTASPLLPLEDIRKHASVFQRVFTEHIQALANVTTNNDLDKVLKEGSESVIGQLKVLSTNLQDVLSEANGKVRDVVQSSYRNIEKSIADLRAHHVDVPKRTEKLRDSLQEAVKSAVIESQKIAKEVADNIEETNQKLGPKIQAAYEDFVKNAQEVQKKISTAAAGNKV